MAFRRWRRGLAAPGSLPSSRLDTKNFQCARKIQPSRFTARQAHGRQCCRAPAPLFALIRPTAIRSAVPKCPFMFSLFAVSVVYIMFKLAGASG